MSRINISSHRCFSQKSCLSLSHAISLSPDGIGILLYKSSFKANPFIHCFSNCDLSLIHINLRQSQKGPVMNFGSAIKSGFNGYFDFSGRSSRSEFGGGCCLPIF